MQVKFFSIIVAALNPGERLQATLDSIMGQTFKDYEVILKDGGSTDGSLERLEAAGFFARYPQIRIVQRPDTGIYDGMNQAVHIAEGEFLYFLNCGDYLYDENVLKKVADSIKSRRGIQAVPGQMTGGISGKTAHPAIYYGNQFNRREGALIHSAPRIDDFTCYRNVPCHQVCFYDRELFRERAYDLTYRVRADYEHFLYCIYEKKAEGVAMPITVVSYEGGGFSETKENRRRSAGEHREICVKYLGEARVGKYRLMMWLTLAPLRTKIAATPALAGIYNEIKRGIYRILQRS